MIRYLIGAAAVTIGWATYVAYLRDVIAGRTRPHVFSWFMWAFATLVAYAVQVAHGAGLGAFAGSAAPAIACLAVFVLGVRQGGERDITRMDVIFLASSLGALGLWLVADRPLTAIVLLTAVDVLAFVPTARKAWVKPHEETVSCYVGGAVRTALALTVMGQYDAVTVLYPAVWLVANGGFAVFLLSRRGALAPVAVAVPA
jgi:hypothetical protein